MDAVVSGNIPIGAGLSSSAAIEVAVGFTLLKLSGSEIILKDLALAAQKAENDFVGMRCGIMDQYISCLGQTDHALLIDCRDLSYQNVPLPVEASVVIVDSGVHRGLMDMERTVFISYRRDDSAGYVGRLYDRIKERFGEKSVFMDIDAIPPGEDFVEVIERAVSSCDVLLAVIGKQWLTITDTGGHRRLE